MKTTSTRAPTYVLVPLSQQTIVNHLSLQSRQGLYASSAAAAAAAGGVWKTAMVAILLLLAVVVAQAQQQQQSPDATTAAAAAAAPSAPAASVQDTVAPLIVEGMESGDVFGLGRSVEIRGRVEHGAISFGGDVIITGRVEGDVATIGGSVIQREGSYIGGDVIVIGGAYNHGKSAPGRNPASTTVMIAGYEQELREVMRDPKTLLTPRWSLLYAGMRVLAVLFWFIVSLALTAATPGAVSRAAARLQLTNLRVAVIGFLGSIVVAFGVPLSLRILPTMLSVLVVITAVLFLTIAYLFGRVVIHAATGRWLQRLILPEGKHSESVALLLGAGFWAVVLSLPYVWPLLVAGLVVTSLGLALTARYRVGWKRTQNV
ncbi:MAG TPA: hypothetical protein VGX92_06970 [Pyrinomonadaceae bacterium]|nr:hypothetical protein [Pyrinomonadaceae bacterium]